MSLIRANLFSKKLLRTVDVTVVLPVDKEQHPESFKTLYLLHGILGDDLDWVNNTRIKMWAEANNLAVVMPSGENGYYVNDEDGLCFYSDFIGEELVEITRKMFPLSSKRDDTFIAGLSMGGYGALTNGLRFNQTFSYIGCLSLALIPDLVSENEGGFSSLSFFKSKFGGTPEQIRNTIKDPRYNLENISGAIPNIYITCGTEDFVLEGNHTIHRFLQEHNVEHIYDLDNGNHDWDYWDQKIGEFLKILPLDIETNHRHSGNIS